MKPTPYAIHDMAPWDFQFDQKTRQHDAALHRLVQLLATSFPHMQSELQVIIQDLALGNEAAHELATARTLMGKSSTSPIELIAADTETGQRISQRLHETGILPRMRQYPSPLALLPESLIDFSAEYQRDEPTLSGSVTAQDIEGFYLSLLVEAHDRQHAMVVNKATLFNNSNEYEPVVIVPIYANMALVLQVHRRTACIMRRHHDGTAYILTVSRYTGLPKVLEDFDQVFDRALADTYLQRLPATTQALLSDPTEGETRQQAFQRYVTLAASFDAELKSEPVSVDLGHSPGILSGMVRYALHEQIGAYTSITTSQGEVVLRHDVPDVIYGVGGSKEKPELIEIPAIMVPPVSYHLLVQALQQAIAIWSTREEENEEVQRRMTPRTSDAAVAGNVMGIPAEERPLAD